MEQLISIIMFTIPGLLVYFWVQAYGLNPVVKHTPTELAAITALFWVPTVLLVVMVYDLLYVVFDFCFKHLQIDLSSWNLNLIKTLADIHTSSSNIFFFTFFFILSIIFSNFVARFWIKLYDEKVLKYINEYRISRNLTKLSDTTAVWDAFFHKLNSKKEESLVVEIYKIDKPEEVIAGSITKMSRPYEMERALVLEHTSEWMEYIKNKPCKKERAYIDIKSGIVVREIIIESNPSSSSEVAEAALQRVDQQNADD